MSRDPRADELKTTSPVKGATVEQLAQRAAECMEQRGLSISFSEAALREVQALAGPARLSGEGVCDLRHLDWASIDNEDTKDIDQLAYAQRLEDGRIQLLVAIADVAESVPKGSALDAQIQQNTVTVYTSGKVFPMLPEQLSTDWTSLGPGQDRRAMVTELLVEKDGQLEQFSVYQAAVRNRAKLDYAGVSRWAEGGASPAPLLESEGMKEQIVLQLEVGLRLEVAAAQRGALEFEADRVMPVVEGGSVVDLVVEKKNVASEAVANMMIAANMANAKFLHQRGFPVFQRVVEAPERWDRMLQVAGEAAGKLPAGQSMEAQMSAFTSQPDPAALSAFLREFKRRDPENYGAVSGSLLKLMGGGDYKVVEAGQALRGHFGQGVRGGEEGYVHSTAPNRRLPDVIIQRLIKAALRGESPPYSVTEMQEMADHCNKQESAARGVEREMRKVATGRYLETQVGQEFNASITGVNPKKGVFLKVGDPPIEGKLADAAPGLDVGDPVRVRLQRVDAERGHIDFVLVSPVS